MDLYARHPTEEEFDEYLRENLQETTCAFVNIAAQHPNIRPSVEEKGKGIKYSSYEEDDTEEGTKQSSDEEDDMLQVMEFSPVLLSITQIHNQLQQKKCQLLGGSSGGFMALRRKQQNQGNE
jgi:hypothetical protein